MSSLAMMNLQIKVSSYQDKNYLEDQSELIYQEVKELQNKVVVLATLTMTQESMLEIYHSKLKNMN